jgi:uncharacterized membrane protein (DUF106 family)
MTIQEQIQKYRCEAALFRYDATRATDEREKARLTKLAEAKMDCADAKMETLQTYLEEDTG